MVEDVLKAKVLSAGQEAALDCVLRHGCPTERSRSGCFGSPADWL